MHADVVERGGDKWRIKEPEKGDLSEVCRPPHFNRVNQIPPQYAGPSISQYLPYIFQ